MGLIKKVDVEKHFAARRAMMLGRMEALGQLGGAGTKSAIKTDKASASTEVLSASIPLESPIAPARFKGRPR
jgi:hypothetical protein